MSNDAERPVLEIDGVSIPIHLIWIHYQRNPFPGGHDYHLHLPESFALVLAQRLGRSVTTEAADEAKETLYWLSSILSDLPEPYGTEDVGIMYVLNSVEKVIANENGSTDIYGACSPFLK